MKNNRANIRAVYQLASLTEQADGAAWYHAARQIAIKLADRYKITEPQAIGVIAALSPRNRWERNVHDADAFISAYVAGGAEQAMLTKVCTFTSNKKKALQILESGLTHITSALTILSGPKLKEFASCIAGLPDVCIDGHSYCIWAGERTSLKDVPAIGVKLRREIKADYQQVAEELEIEPFELQAITWCAWRRIYGVTK